MKFNKHLPKETQEMLEKQYREYIKTTQMTKKEQRAVREWVKDGHSVYENPSGAWYDGQVPVEFLSVYRDEEYIRQHTKGMNSEDARRFALEYYGWSDEEELRVQCEEADLGFNFQISENEELPFQ